MTANRNSLPSKMATSCDVDDSLLCHVVANAYKNSLLRSGWFFWLCFLWSFTVSKRLVLNILLPCFVCSACYIRYNVIFLFFFSSITINKCVCAIEFTVSFLRKVLIFIISFVFCKIPDPRFPLSRFPVVHHSPLSFVFYRFVSLFFFC